MSFHNFQQDLRRMSFKIRLLQGMLRAPDLRGLIGTGHPWNSTCWKRRFLLETTIFWGTMLVSGRVDTSSLSYLPTSSSSQVFPFWQTPFFAAQKPVAFAAPRFGTQKSPFRERHKKKRLHWEANPLVSLRSSTNLCHENTKEREGKLGNHPFLGDTIGRTHLWIHCSESSGLRPHKRDGLEAFHSPLTTYSQETTWPQQSWELLKFMFLHWWIPHHPNKPPWS